MASAGKGPSGGLLVGLAVLLPFEVPLFTLGPLTVTSVELLLYLTVAAWLPWARPRALARDPLARAAAVWLAVVGAAALAAPDHRAEALKVALRGVAAGMVFFAARETVQRRALAYGLVAGAALSALTAILGVSFPWSGPTFTALGVARASGPFAYPTIAAMVWEASLPLVVLILAGGRAAARAALVAALAVALVAAVILSATRAALVGIVIAAALLALLGDRRARLGAGILAGVTVVLLAVTVARPGSLLGQRLALRPSEGWFAARYQAAPVGEIGASQARRVRVSVQNTGELGWPAGGNDAVHLSYHWETPAGILVEYDGLRTRLPGDVAPGATVALDANVRAPAAPGRYRLRWDLVRETVTWFSERGSATADELVTVAGVAAAGPAPTGGTLDERGARPTPSRRELWRAAVRLWRRHPVLGVGPDNFRHLYAAVIEPAPGVRLFLDERLHANSLYLETLADLGLAGVAALALLGRELARALWRGRRDPLARAAAVGAVTFFVHGVVDTFGTFTPTLVLGWLLLALTAPPDTARSAPAPSPP